MAREQARTRDTHDHGDRGMQRPGTHAQERARRQPDPWWQWLVAAVGALLVLGTTGYLAYRGMNAPEGPPSVRLDVRHIAPVAGGYVVVVEARNVGGETAAQLEVRGELWRGTQLLDEHEFMLDYLPPDSSRRAGLFFTHDPRAPGVELRIAPAGYSTP